MHLDPLLPLLVGAAIIILLLGLILTHLKQPALIGYLIAGVLIGPGVLAAVGLQTGMINVFGYQTAVAVIALTLLVSPIWFSAAKRLFWQP